MRSEGAALDRQTLLISVCITLVVGIAIVFGIGFLTRNIKSNVSSFQSPRASHSVNRQYSLDAPAAPTSTPWTPARAQAYATEQANRAAGLRQEERARQLEETRRANQQIIDERTRGQQQRQEASRRSAEQEFTIPLGAFTRVTLAGKSYRLAVHDDGPDEIRVLIDYHPVLRFQKHNGFEGHDIETLILSNGSAHLYYVNEISDHVGHCKLRLRDQ